MYSLFVHERVRIDVMSVYTVCVYTHTNNVHRWDPGGDQVKHIEYVTHLVTGKIIFVAGGGFSAIWLVGLKDSLQTTISSILDPTLLNALPRRLGNCTFRTRVLFNVLVANQESPTKSRLAY